jgi:propionyl-CoA synthetase
MSKYKEMYNQSILKPEQFWKDRSKIIPWIKSPETILSQDTNGFYRWFGGGTLNTSYLALDYHIENGRGSQIALIYDSPVTQTKKKYTYTELRDAVAIFAGVLKKHGLEKGDTVIIYMPMVPEAVIGMLACARLGIVHSVVFGGFAPHELAIRIDDCKPKLILTASYGIEVQKILHYKPMLDEAIHQATHKPNTVILYERPNMEDFMHTGRDFYWDEEIQTVSPEDPVELLATDPLYILYTSGTTGKPKGVVRDNGGHAVALKYSMETIYDMNEGDVFWAASDVGWVVGHSYIVYAPLLKGCTTIVYEGKPVKTPDAGAFWRIIDEYKVKALFTAPTAIRAIKKEDPDGELLKKYDLSSLKYLFLAGERTDPPTLQWAENLLKIPIIDHWWQTETGYAIVGNLMGVEPVPYKPGSSTRPYFGFDVQILDEEGNHLEANQQGQIVVKLPLPPGCLPTLWNDDSNFKSSYLSHYEGYYLTGDGGYIDDDGYVFIMGRTDDVINVAGHRLSTGEMEEIIASHKDIAECAVIGINDEVKGQVPLAMVIVKDGVKTNLKDIEKDILHLIREEIGAIASLKSVVVVSRLPKTRSGKILRKTMRKMIDGEANSVPSTIDDPSSLDEIKELMMANGIGKID